MNVLKYIAIYFSASVLHALTTYFTFCWGASLGYSGKSNAVMFKVLAGIQYVLWLPLGLLQYTKFADFLNNYIVALILNSFIAVGIVFLVIYILRK